MSVQNQQLQPWPPPWARSLAFIVGLGLMIWETVIDKGQNLVVYGPAFLLTGLPIARGVESLLDRLPWGNNSPPPESPALNPPPQQPQVMPQVRSTETSTESDEDDPLEGW